MPVKMSSRGYLEIALGSGCASSKTDLSFVWSRPLGGGWNADIATPLSSCSHSGGQLRRPAHSPLTGDVVFGQRPAPPNRGQRENSRISRVQ